MYLVWVCVKIKVLQESRGEFTENKVMSVVDGPQAGVCVVVGTGAGTECTHCREGVERRGFTCFIIVLMQHGNQSILNTER